MTTGFWVNFTTLIVEVAPGLPSVVGNYKPFRTVKASVNLFQSDQF